MVNLGAEQLFRCVHITAPSYSLNVTDSGFMLAFSKSQSIFSQQRFCTMWCSLARVRLAGSRLVFMLGSQWRNGWKPVNNQHEKSLNKILLSSWVFQYDGQECPRLDFLCQTMALFPVNWIIMIVSGAQIEFNKLLSEFELWCFMPIWACGFIMLIFPIKQWSYCSIITTQNIATANYSSEKRCWLFSGDIS